MSVYWLLLVQTEFRIVLQTVYLFFGFFCKPNLWGSQMLEFTKSSNIVVSSLFQAIYSEIHFMIIFKISSKSSPHHAKLSSFSKTIPSPHCLKNCTSFNVNFQFEMWLKKSGNKYKIVLVWASCSVFSWTYIWTGFFWSATEM